MDEYIEREKVLSKAAPVAGCFSDMISAYDVIMLPAADVAPVRHGRWIEHEETQEDAYWHHKCSECNVNAPFDYKMREDWDEGMDGERD